MRQLYFCDGRMRIPTDTVIIPGNLVGRFLLTAYGGKKVSATFSEYSIIIVNLVL